MTSLDATHCCILVAERVIFTDKFIHNYSTVDNFLFEAVEYLQYCDLKIVDEKEESLGKSDESSLARRISPSAAQQTSRSSATEFSCREMTRRPSEDEICPGKL